MVKKHHYMRNRKRLGGRQWPLSFLSFSSRLERQLHGREISVINWRNIDSFFHCLGHVYRFAGSIVTNSKA